MIYEILLGTAIGDAFGAGVEFQDRDWIRQFVDFTQFVNARHQINVSEEKRENFTLNYSPWDYTDDTEMTIGVLKALHSDKSFSEELLVSCWHEEYKMGIAQKGYGRNGHGSMAWFYNGSMSIEEVREFQRFRKNPGNAPAMRSAFLGLQEEELISDYCRINANSTHPNQIAIISSELIARAAYYILVLNGSQKEVIKYCTQVVQINDQYKSYLEDIDRLVPYEKLKEKDFTTLCGPQPIREPYFLPGIKGLPSDSKYTAGAVLYLLKHSTNAFDALKKSIYLGGDVDSVASITTGIIAGKYGLKSIPEFMLENVEGKDYFKSLSIEYGK